MPRPNRYHPYTRDSQRPSSRYSPGSAPRPARRMPAIAEEPPTLPHPYHYIKPDFIRGVTLEGKPLVAKSIIQSADGVYHVQLQVAPFPSEQARLLGCGGPYASPSVSPLLPPHLSPAPSALSFGTQEMQRKVSGSFSSQDRSSEDSAVTTDEDADAEGELDDFDQHRWKFLMEQQRFMNILASSESQMQLGH